MFLPKKNVYFYIYSSIKEKGKLPSKNKIKLSKQALNRYIKKLVIEGVIEKIGYGTWVVKKPFPEKLKEVNMKKEVNKHSKVGSEVNMKKEVNKLDKKVVKVKKIRGHGFMFSFKIPVVSNWSRRSEYLDRKKIVYHDLKNLSGVYGQRLVFRGYKIWLTAKKIIVFFPVDKSYITDNAKESRDKAVYDAVKILKRLENFLKTSFIINKNYQFKISRQHYAEIDNELAEQYNSERKKLRVKDEDGEEWLLIDKSLGFDELETVNPETAQDDMDDVIKPFFNDLRGNPVTTNELLSLMKLMIVQHGETVKNVKDLSAGLQTLIMALYSEGFKKQKNEEKKSDTETGDGVSYIG